METKNLSSIRTHEEKTVKSDNKLCIDKAVDHRLSQSKRFIAKARELGLDEREEVFDAALAKVARHKPAAPAKKGGSDDSLQAAHRD